MNIFYWIGRAMGWALDQFMKGLEAGLEDK